MIIRNKLFMRMVFYHTKINKILPYCACFSFCAQVPVNSMLAIINSVVNDNERHVEGQILRFP